VSYSCMTVKYADSHLRAPRLIVALTPPYPWRHEAGAAWVSSLLLISSLLPRSLNPQIFLRAQIRDVIQACELLWRSDCPQGRDTVHFVLGTRRFEGRQRIQNVLEASTQREVSRCNRRIGLNTFILTGMVNNKTAMHV
jgi:hypothetical protein